MWYIFHIWHLRVNKNSALMKKITLLRILFSVNFERFKFAYLITTKYPVSLIGRFSNQNYLRVLFFAQF